MMGNSDHEKHNHGQCLLCMADQMETLRVEMNIVKVRLDVATQNLSELAETVQKLSLRVPRQLR